MADRKKQSGLTWGELRHRIASLPADDIAELTVEAEVPAGMYLKDGDLLRVHARVVADDPHLAPGPGAEYFLRMR